MALHKRRSNPEPTHIGHALDNYEVRIEGYFDEVFPAVSEDHAIAELRKDLPLDFTVDDATAWRVNSDNKPTWKPRKGKHSGDA